MSDDGNHRSAREEHFSCVGIGGFRPVSIPCWLRPDPREHGEDAALEAAQRADAMPEKDGLDGERVWFRILKATEELLNSRPSKGVAIH